MREGSRAYVRQRKARDRGGDGDNGSYDIGRRQTRSQQEHRMHAARTVVIGEILPRQALQMLTLFVTGLRGTLQLPRE